MKGSSAVTRISLGGPSSIPSGILKSFSGSLPTGTGTGAPMSGVIPSNKSAGAQPVVTGVMRLMAAAAVF